MDDKTLNKIFELVKKYCKKCDALAIESETSAKEEGEITGKIVDKIVIESEQLMYKGKAQSLAEKVYLKQDGPISKLAKEFLDLCVVDMCFEADECLSNYKGKK